jgi:hypothetical protein
VIIASCPLARKLLELVKYLGQFIQAECLQGTGLDTREAQNSVSP